MSEIRDDDSDIPTLSGNALEALIEFYAKREVHEKQFEDLKSKTNTGEARDHTLTMDAFTENWNNSQFWYSQQTAEALARELLASCDSKSTIAVISAPSAFIQLKNIIVSSFQASVSMTADQIPKIYLLEYDKRFSVFPEFVFYDYRYPFKLPSSMKASIDHIICDPPFLSNDCQTKAALTTRWLSRSWGAVQSLRYNNPAPDVVTSRLIVCTGERMGGLVNKLYGPQGIRTTTFEPIHEKGLGNEFYCYANFECGSWKWRT